MDNKDLQEGIVNEDFKVQLKTLKEIYKQSTLKEKHKLNEHIKFILQAHGAENTKTIERDLK